MKRVRSGGSSSRGEDLAESTALPDHHNEAVGFGIASYRSSVSNPPPLLVDGSPPATTAELLARLHELGIAVRTVEHEPVFTVAEAKNVRDRLPGGHTKSLFLRDKRGTMWLVCCHEDQVVDLTQLGSNLGAKRLSFGSAERLMRFLGVIPGAVSPFSVINDRGRAVLVVIDPEVLTHEPINLHPLDNSKTTAISAAGLLRFLDAEGHPPELLKV